MNKPLPRILDRAFFRSIASEKPQLFGAVLAFNAQVHGTDEKWQCLANGSKRSLARLTGPFNNGFWDFEEESRRLALLEPPTFERLILSFGAAFCAPLLNRVILKKDVQILEERLSAKLLDFARGRGRFFIGNLSEFMTLYDPGRDAAALADMVPRYGLDAFGLCCATWPAPLLEIQKQRFAATWSQCSDTTLRPVSPTPAQFRAVWFSLKKILLKEVAPEWSLCFS